MAKNKEKEKGGGFRKWSLLLTCANVEGLNKKNFSKVNNGSMHVLVLVWFIVKAIHIGLV